MGWTTSGTSGRRFSTGGSLPSLTNCANWGASLYWVGGAAAGFAAGAAVGACAAAGAVVAAAGAAVVGLGAAGGAVGCAGGADGEHAARSPPPAAKPSSFTKVRRVDRDWGIVW